MEIARAIAANNTIFVLAPTVSNMLGDGLPLAQVGINAPVDHLGNFFLNALGHIADNLHFKFALDTLFLDQIENAPQPYGFIEIGLAALLHLVEHIIYI